jgi:glycosyltransferase involved in cell wall biosynthesis
MKAGMILDGFFPPDPRVENEALTLIELGHEVHLFCFAREGEPSAESMKGIQVHRYPVSRHISKLSALAYTLPWYHNYLKSRLRDFIHKSAADVLHIHDIQIARTIFWLKKELPSVPVILDLHENRPEIMKHYRHVVSLPGKWVIYPEVWKKFEYQYIRECDRLVVVTEEARKHYVERVGIEPKKIHVIPNFVRKSFYTDYFVDEGIMERYQGRFVLLYLGDTGERRGIRTMIQAVAKLKDRIPEILLVIVGKSKDDTKWLEMVRGMALSDHVELSGWQDFTLFPSYILASSIGICPIHRNIHHETTFANKIFQSLAFEKPVIVSNCASQMNLVNHFQCGLVFEDRNPLALAECVLQLYHDKTVYTEMAKNGSEAIRNRLNWDTISIVMETLYGSLSKEKV